MDAVEVPLWNQREDYSLYSSSMTWTIEFTVPNRNRFMKSPLNRRLKRDVRFDESTLGLCNNAYSHKLGCPKSLDITTPT